MDDRLDELVTDLQAEIYRETKEEWGEKAFERWQRPRYMGAMPDADAKAVLTGSCGDRMEIYLRMADRKVADAGFFTDGCGPSIVCGSFAAELSLGKGVEELFDVTGQDILATVGGLPQDHEHCAFLAANTLRAAAEDFMSREARSEKSRPGSDKS